MARDEATHPCDKRGLLLVVACVVLLHVAAAAGEDLRLQRKRPRLGRARPAHVTPMMTMPLLQQLAAANVDFFGTHRVYRYPDAPGQTKEELVACYRSANRRCGKGGSDPCDPDDDASPVRQGAFVRVVMHRLRQAASCRAR